MGKGKSRQAMQRADQKHRLSHRARLMLGCAVRWITTRTGYTEDHLRGGLQLAVGVFILMAALSTPRVWSALSLPDAFISPVYAVVSLCIVLQPNLGTAFQFVFMRALGAVVGGVLGLLCMYITFGANGSTYQNSTTKSAVMVVMLGVFSFGLGLFRFRYSQYWFAFVVAIFSMPVVALSSFWLQYVQYKTMFFWWLQVGLGVVVAGGVSILVTPITAGRKVRAKTQASLRGLGEITNRVLDTMLLVELREDGLMAGVEGRVEGPNAIDAGLQKEMAPIYEKAAELSGQIEAVRTLLHATVTEYDVYRATHVFPVQPYDLLKLNTRAFLSSLMMLVYSLQSGRLSLRAVHAFQRELREAGQLLGGCLEDLAGCIDGTVQFKGALRALRRLERHWRTLGVLCPTPRGGWSENDVLTCDMVVATLFNLGTRVRRMFLAMPDAIRGEQPDSRRQAARHFKTSGVWDMQPPKGALRSRALQRTGTPISARIEADLPSPRALSSPPGSSGGGGKGGGKKGGASQQSRFLRSRSYARLVGGVGLGSLEEEGSSNGDAASPLPRTPPPPLRFDGSFPPLLPVPPLNLPPRHRLMVAVREASGFTDLHISLALQLALGVAAAAVLHVCGASYTALGEKTVWVAITVAVVFESSVGGIILKCTLRMMGTVLAGLLGLGLLYWVVLLNGGHYQNDPGKFIAMTAFLPLVLGFIMMNHMRIPHKYAYFMSVAKFTTPIVALSGYIGTVVSWETALWRLCNIAVGIGIDLVVTLLVFPVTGKRATKFKIQEALNGLATLSEAVLTQFVSGASYQAASPLGSPLAGGGGRGGGPLLRSSTMETMTPLALTPQQSLASGSATPDIEMGILATQQAREEQQAQLPLPPQQAQHGGEPEQGEGQMVGALLRGEGGAGDEGVSHEAQRAQQQGGGMEGGHPSMLDLVLRDGGGRGGREGEGTRSPGRIRSLSTPRRRRAPAGGGGASFDFGTGAEVAELARSATALLHPSHPTGGVERGVQGVQLQIRFPAGLDSMDQEHLGPPSESDPLPCNRILFQQGVPSSPPEPAEKPGTAGAAGHEMPRHQSQHAQRSSPDGSRVPDLEGLDPAPLPLPPIPLSPPFHQQATGGGRTPPSCASPPRHPEGGSPAGGEGRGRASSKSPPPSPDRHRLELPPLHIPPHPPPVHPQAASPGAGVPATPGSREDGAPPLHSPLPPRTTSWERGTGFLGSSPRSKKLRAQRTLWMQRHVLGRVFITVHDRSVGVAALINDMGELAVFSKYEWDPFGTPRRLQQEDIRTAQRACRKMLNVLLSIAYVLDAPDVPHLVLLKPFKEEVQIIAAQMRSCLEALSHVIGGHLELDTALAMVSTLALQVQLLLLEVEQGVVPEETGEADVVLGYASLGVLFSAMQTVQVLYRAVIKLLRPVHEQEAVEQSFQETATWGASMEGMLLAQGVVLSHLASEEEGVAEAVEEEEGRLRMVE